MERRSSGNRQMVRFSQTDAELFFHPVNPVHPVKSPFFTAWFRLSGVRVCEPQQAMSINQSALPFP